MSAAKEQKKESLEDILNAIKDKEDVLKPLPEDIQKKREKKEKKEKKAAAKNVEASIKQELAKPQTPTMNFNPKLEKMASYFTNPIKYFFLKFFGGFFMGLGFIIAIFLVFHLLILLRDISFISSMFDKMVVLMKSMIG